MVKHSPWVNEIKFLKNTKIEIESPEQFDCVKLKLMLEGGKSKEFYINNKELLDKIHHFISVEQMEVINNDDTAG